MSTPRSYRRRSSSKGKDDMFDESLAVKYKNPYMFIGVLQLRKIEKYHKIYYTIKSGNKEIKSKTYEATKKENEYNFVIDEYHEFLVLDETEEFEVKIHAKKLFQKEKIIGMIKFDSTKYDNERVITEWDKLKEEDSKDKFSTINLEEILLKQELKEDFKNYLETREKKKNYMEFLEDFENLMKFEGDSDEKLKDIIMKYISEKGEKTLIGISSDLKNKILSKYENSLFLQVELDFDKIFKDLKDLVIKTLDEQVKGFLDLKKQKYLNGLGEILLKIQYKKTDEGNKYFLKGNFSTQKRFERNLLS
jgi:hypothetical protein